MSMFQYEFMRVALATGFLLALIMPCIGIILVLRRLSMLGDTLSHASLAGVAVGLIGGFNPVLGALGASLLAAFSIDGLRKIFPRYQELSIAIMMSIGIGLAGILSGFVRNTTSFTSFLFGSIVAISRTELILTVIACIVVLASFIIMYRQLLYISFDENAARRSGIPVRLVTGIFTFLTAVTISLAARTVGALIVASLLVIPVATALQVAKSYKQTVLYAIFFGELAMLPGLAIAWYFDLKPGGTIVLTSVAILLLVFAYSHIRKTLGK
ncbi:metal ABC transporter permease [Parasphaerochaeta coccoides]|uniref:ABC-3 protein n=1 Tax=Parasphaerochaeta coccoides (strain ATCC BAA-1237 / DSM 17374 / SPN1) TaxID=760011 RepID=F4GKP8_PARC1|nr:metal ABC transporter permease [Parasphaerochaeta coccoides]AEC01457.1 ABC-3 protein [Parasphaerochaeta coccoides DSM 17374]